jgi:hypothetical protein
LGKIAKNWDLIIDPWRDSNSRSSFFQEARFLRFSLHRLLTKAFYGDALSAEYVLFNLISKIYVRRDRLCLGKLSLNLFNLPLGLFLVFLLLTSYGEQV